MSETSTTEIRAFLQQYIREKSAAGGKNAPAELDDDCDLLLSGMIDSLGLLELMTAIQQHCQRDIDFEALDPEQLTVVGPLCRYVSQQLAGR
ncbi:MAG TPA: acyl carrier protein [Candidatus Acidoferrum sp.]|nr:acyl carrier protein [Candidatus Acidoferrum sp.]